jgi:hypothetical protein
VIRPTDAERQEELRVGWRLYGPLCLGMALCLLASMQHADSWLAWPPIALLWVLFAFTETHLRRRVKRTRENTDEPA